MDNQAKETLKILKQYLDEIEVSHEGWENIFRMLLMTNGKMLELSAHLATSKGLDKINMATNQIMSSIVEIHKAIREAEPSD